MMGDRSMLRTLRRRRDESGYALLTVLLAMFVLTTVVTGALGYALQTQVGSRRDQDYNAALAAARAGVDDLLARLNKNDTYWQTYPGYSSTPSSWDCTNPAWQRPWPTSPVPCGWGAGTPVGWVPVPGSSTAAFHYDLDLSSTPVDGVVLITSTGKVGKVTRTVQVSLRHGGFGEFLYFTDFETVDPSNEAVYGYNNGTAQSRCSKYYWAGRDTSYCYDINFVGGDTLNGPVHSNDAMLTLGNPGPVFKGPVTTSWPACNGVTTPSRWPNRCYRPNGSTTPTFEKGLGFRDVITLPGSIGSLRQYVDPAQTPTPGCLYTGPTRIVFNPDGTMKVWSTWSTTLNPGCGNPSAPWPQTLSVPQNNVIYVQDVPAAQTSPSSGACPVGSIGDGLPVANDFNSTLRESDCRSGTAYVEGTLRGKVTLSADNNVVVTGNLTYAGGPAGIDTLGLIANNSVKVYHPVKCTRTSGGVCTAGQNLNRPNGTVFRDPVINAAILTLQHSFTVQMYQIGSSLGTLSLFGSFAQRYRGPVGTTLPSGYYKDYVYDTRLRYAPPPYFLDPVSSTWGPKTFGEIKPAYPG